MADPVTVFLVRHGSHDLLGRTLCGRMPGVCLNGSGLQEAARAAARLSRERLSAIYASPLERTQETAGVIADRLGLSIATAPELNELNFGDWTGLAFADLHRQPLWADWNRERSAHRPPGGETMGEAQARVLAWLDRISERHRGGAIAAVCHSDVIKAVICAGIGLALDHHHRLSVDPGSISIVEARPGRLQVRTVNEIPPLDLPAEPPTDRAHVDTAAETS